MTTNSEPRAYRPSMRDDAVGAATNPYVRIAYARMKGKTAYKTVAGVSDRGKDSTDGTTLRTSSDHLVEPPKRHTSWP